MFRAAVQNLANYPWASDALRGVVEGQFRTLKHRTADFLSDDPRATLDCGCGTGIFAPLVPPSQYYGVDLSETNLVAARKRCPQHRFQKMDAEKLEFGVSQFDRVFVIGVFHHLSDRSAAAVCCEIRRVLKPGGRLLVIEDIPTRQRWNLVGRAVHSLDLGAHIRNLGDYRKILEAHFAIAEQHVFTSGFMDYVAFEST